MLKKLQLSYCGNLTIHSLAHFLMDFMCHYYAFRVIAATYPKYVFELFLLYNFIAFALQCPIGLIADRFEPEMGETFSFGLVMLGWIMGFGANGCTLLEVIGLIFCGFGNAFFHTAGSGAVMKVGKKGVVSGGVFVSFGALGVGLGDYLGRNGKDIVFPMMFVVIICGTLFFFLGHKKAAGERSGRVQFKPDRKELICLALCLMAIFVRSYGGFLIPGSAKELLGAGDGLLNQGFWPAMFSGTVGFLGKFAGGFCVLLLYALFRSHGLNVRLRGANLLWGVIALFISFWLLVPFGESPVCALIGTILFHSVMPVTLYEVFAVFPARPGFAMGLTTLMLFAGMLPAYIKIPDGLTAKIVLGVIILIAAAGLFVSYRLVRREGRSYGDFL